MSSQCGQDVKTCFFLFGFNTVSIRRVSSLELEPFLTPGRN